MQRKDRVKMREYFDLIIEDKKDNISRLFRDCPEEAKSVYDYIQSKINELTKKLLEL